MVESIVPVAWSRVVVANYDSWMHRHHNCVHFETVLGKRGWQSMRKFTLSYGRGKAAYQQQWAEQDNDGIEVWVLADPQR